MTRRIEAHPFSYLGLFPFPGRKNMARNIGLKGIKAIAAKEGYLSLKNSVELLEKHLESHDYRIYVCRLKELLLNRIMLILVP